MDEKKINELLEGVMAGLTDEQKAKASACKDTKELLDLLGDLGVELPDELLDSAAGGFMIDGNDGIQQMLNAQFDGQSGAQRGIQRGIERGIQRGVERGVQKGVQRGMK